MISNGPLAPLQRKRRQSHPVKLVFLGICFVLLCSLAVHVHRLGPRAPEPEPVIAATPSVQASGPQDEAAKVPAEVEGPVMTFLTLYGQSATDPSRLVPVTMEVPRDLDLREQIQRIVVALQQPLPDAAVLPTIPKGTRVLAVFQTKQDLYVDLSREFVLHHPGGSLECCMTVHSLVNSLTRLPGIRRVKFLIGGQEETDFKGHLDFGPAYEFNGHIVAGEDDDGVAASPPSTTAEGR